jgi:hypothetical protein
MSFVSQKENFEISLPGPPRPVLCSRTRVQRATGRFGSWTSRCRPAADRSRRNGTGRSPPGFSHFRGYRIHTSRDAVAGCLPSPFFTTGRGRGWGSRGRIWSAPVLAESATARPLTPPRKNGAGKSRLYASPARPVFRWPAERILRDQPGLGGHDTHCMMSRADDTLSRKVLRIQCPRNPRNPCPRNPGPVLGRGDCSAVAAAICGVYSQSLARPDLDRRGVRTVNTICRARSPSVSEWIDDLKAQSFDI